MIAFWTAVLALTVFLYVTLDGFDLGVGMLLPLARDDAQRKAMLATIAPVWDANETWLVLNGTILFAVFPLTYATLLSAFYLPLVVMLCALIFRGVAFEFRARATRLRRLWDRGFIAGSYIVALVQGTAVGALVHGLPMAGTVYVGGAFGWLSPFALACGVGLCIGYALMGAGWLTYKSAPDVRDLGFALMPGLLGALLAFLGAVLWLALHDHLAVMRRWIDLPVLAVFPAIGVIACAVMVQAIRRRAELVPFFCAVALFAAALGTLSASFWPWMVPFAISTAQAAAPRSAQLFFFWGAGLVLLPVTLVYTLTIYLFFKGKTDLEDEAY